MKIIPAIDLIDGQAVRLEQGQFSKKKIYHSDPLELAKSFEAAGIQYLHLVDLDGAKAGSPQNLHVLESIASKTGLKLDFGGGIKKEEDLQGILNAGAMAVSIGSFAVNKPETLIEWTLKYGSEKFIIGADFKDRFIRTNAWKNNTGFELIDFIVSFKTQGLNRFLCTDISKDGMLQGPAFKIYEEVIQKTNVDLIASGGVRDKQDLIQLKELGCDAAIVGKAFYENRITLEEMAELC